MDFSDDLYCPVWDSRFNKTRGWLDELKREQPGVYEHTIRVVKLVRITAGAIGRPLAKNGNLFLGAMLHDIGKLTLPKRILNKAGKLNAKEWEIMRSHAEQGATILKKVVKNIDQELIHIIRYHHENLDGSGYYGLKGKKIPAAARLLRIVDSYDAMCDSRGYNRPKTHGEAMDELWKYAGIWYDAEFLSKFAQVTSLLHLINERKVELVQAVANDANAFTNPEVIRKSEQLDKLIVELMRYQTEHMSGAVRDKANEAAI